MMEHKCVKYDMCHIVKSRIRHNNTKREFCVLEEGYECAFFISKTKSGFDNFTNMSCEGCEAEKCAEACQKWIEQHDATIRNQTLDEIRNAKWVTITAPDLSLARNDIEWMRKCDLLKKIESLRTPSTQEHERK